MRFLALALALAAVPARAQDGGALPKGDLKKIDAAKAAGPDKAGKKRSCLVDFAHPPGGNAVFTDDGRTLWLLATTEGPKREKKAKGKEADKEKDKPAGSDASQQRLTLYKVTFGGEEPKVDLVMSTDYRPGAALITHENPVSAVSIVSYAGEAAGCFEGPATVVSVVLAKRNEKAVQTTGEFQLVATPKDWMLSDQKGSRILLVDHTSFQAKTLRKIPAGERPLFYDRGAERLFVWHDDGKQRGLVRYDGKGAAAKVKRVAFKTGDRALQSGARFAVIRTLADANKVEITELADWSGVEKPGTFAVPLPAIYPVGGVVVDGSFDERVLVVQAGSLVAKQKWQRVFVFDYGKGAQIAVVQTPAKQYVNNALVDPSGTFVVLEVRDAGTRRTAALKVLDLASKQTSEIALPAPR